MQPLCFQCAGETEVETASLKQGLGMGGRLILLTPFWGMKTLQTANTNPLLNGAPTI